MGHSLRAAASLVLLTVLSGGPAAAVFCAEWCAPSHHRGHTAGSAAVREQAPRMDCHGAASARQRIEAHAAPECLDSAFAVGAVGSTPLRPDLTQHGVLALTAHVPLVDRWTPDRSRLADPSHASPPGKAPTSFVLRI